MRKYFQLAKITFQEYLAYRLNFFFWRIRSFVTILVLFFFWSAIYGGREVLLGYEKSQMLTYLIGLVFLRGIILASRTADLGDQIRSGSLLKDLLKPWGYLRFWFTRDLVDKFVNLFFAVVEVAIFISFFKFSFYFPKNLTSVLVFIFLCSISASLYFFISFWLSTIAFWTDQIWATRWLFGIIFLQFLAGGYFPLDVLPPIIGKIASFTPFPYLIYFPLKIWLGQVSPLETVKVIFVSLLWLIAFWFILKKTWQKGMRTYTAYGD